MAMPNGSLVHIRLAQDSQDFWLLTVEIADQNICHSINRWGLFLREILLILQDVSVLAVAL